GRPPPSWIPPPPGGPRRRSARRAPGRRRPAGRRRRGGPRGRTARSGCDPSGASASVEEPAGSSVDVVVEAHPPDPPLLEHQLDGIVTGDAARTIISDRAVRRFIRRPE